MPAIIPIIVAGVTASSTIAAAKMSSSANKKAADVQAAATNHASDLTSKGNADTLAYQQQQSNITNAQHAATEKANYDQWAYRQNGLNDLGSAIGLPNRPIPGYVPTNLGSAAGGGQPPTSGASAQGSGNPTDRNFILSQLQGVYQGLGVQPTGRGTGPTDIEYMADQVAKTGGWTPQNAGYWPDRIKQELGKAGGGAPGQSGPPQTLGAAVLQARPNASPMVTPQPLAPPPMTFGRALGAY